MGICRRVMRATRGGGGGSSMQGGVGSGGAGMDLADGSRIGSMTCGSGEFEGRRRRLSSSMDCCSSRERESFEGSPFRSGAPSSSPLEHRRRYRSPSS
ncbi:hypothetical protein ACQJBY_069489 [Aegilops geniculata]